MTSWLSRLLSRRPAQGQQEPAPVDRAPFVAIDKMIDSREFDQALVLLEARAAISDDPAVHYRIGLIHSDIGHAADAVASFDRVLVHAPEDFRAHNNRGSSLQVLGKFADAESSFRRAIALNPVTDLPRLNLAKLLESMNRREEAAEIYREGMQRAGPESVYAHYLAALEGRTGDRAPDDWVVTTFDAFAPAFERQVRSLGYTVPEQLAALLCDSGARAGDVLDLGCGTGLVGAALAPEPGLVLTGVDLSQRMLEQARARGVYHVLAQGEVHAWLRTIPAESFDTVVAADVLIYIGDLHPLFAEVARVLRPGGRFAFSTEECDGGTYKLLPTGRFAQSEAYVRQAAGSRYSILASTPIVVRQEEGIPLAGRMWLLRTGVADLG